MRKCTEIPPAPKSAREHSSPGAGLSWAGAMGGQTRKESKQHMDQEQNMGVKIIGQRNQSSRKKMSGSPLKKAQEEVSSRQFTARLGAGVFPASPQN